MKKFVTKIKTKVKETAKDIIDGMRYDPLLTLEIGAMLGMGLALTAFTIGVNGASKKTASAKEAYRKGYDKGIDGGVIATTSAYENYLAGTGKTREEINNVTKDIVIRW